MKTVTAKDFKKLAEFIKSESEDRQDKRKDREKQWDEVDAQLKMSEEHARKVRSTRTDNRGDWVPAMVLPQQSTALEVLTADARRMQFPAGRNWFECKAGWTQKEMQSLEQSDLFDSIEQSDRIVDDRIDGDTMDDICEAVMQHNHAKYDMRAMVDILNAEAFKYGEFAGRVLPVKRNVFSETSKGVFKEEEKLVALTPGSIRHTYPDETAPFLMREGMMLQPSWIRIYQQRISDIQLAAKRGNSDISNLSTGGWIKSAVSALREVRGSRTVKIIEYEGDVVIPRSRENLEFINKIVTVSVGKEVRVIRIRELPVDMRSYVHGVYHWEGANEKVGPLMKAAPIHNAMSEVFNRLVAAAIINVEPPVSVPPDDRWIISQGGITVAPREMWQTNGEIKVHQIGDPEKLLQVFTFLLKMYEDLTGVNAPRVGAQTKSHQTAFAVDQEMTRGQTRTIDYVSSTLIGPWATWLHLEWQWLRKTMKRERVWIPKQNGYINISGSLLPEMVRFETHGSAGPLVEQQEEQRRMSSLLQVMQVEQAEAQAGKQSGRPLDIDKIKREMLKNGGWSDPGQFFTEPVPPNVNTGGAGVPQGTADPSVIPGNFGQPA